MAQYRYIRKIDAPQQILTAGYITPDHPVPEGYELVVGRPPEESIMQPSTSKLAQLKVFIRNLSITQQLALGNVIAVALPYAEDDQFDKVAEVIQTAPNPAEASTPEHTAFETIRGELLSMATV